MPFHSSLSSPHIPPAEDHWTAICPVPATLWLLVRSPNPDGSTRLCHLLHQKVLDLDAGHRCKMTLATNAQLLCLVPAQGIVLPQIVEVSKRLPGSNSARRGISASLQRACKIHSRTYCSIKSDTCFQNFSIHSSLLKALPFCQSMSRREISWKALQRIMCCWLTKFLIRADSYWSISGKYGLDNFDN